MAFPFPPSPLYNVSSFDGTIESDYLRYAAIPESEKPAFIDYSITDFASYKTALLDYIKAVYPEDYTNFVESDLGVMFTELFAYLASVISLKADFLANESYISTVQSPLNLNKLLNLIGVSLKGPTAAKAEAVVELPSDFFTGSPTTFTIPRQNRIITTKTDKDDKPVVFTLYKGNTDGRVIFDTSSVADLKFDVNSATFLMGNFFLMEGELVEQSGAFSTTDDNFTIDVSAGPVVEGSLVVSSHGTLWSETESLFLASSTEAVFEKKYDSKYNATITFGNGTKGKRPTPGSSYKLFYRKGGGERGNIARRTLSTYTNGTKSAGGTSQVLVYNNTTATGGRNSESVAHAKKYYPHYHKAQHRCVTGDDYTSTANVFTSTNGVMGKAMAVLRNNGAGANNIDIYCLAKASALQLERCSLSFKGELLDHLNERKMMTDEITLVDGVIRTVDLNCTVKIDSADKTRQNGIKQSAANSLLSYFDVANREFGETLSISKLQNRMHAVEGVRFFSVDNFPGDISVNLNEIIQLNNFELTIDLV